MTSDKTEIAYLGLGSNLGDRMSKLEFALRKLAALPATRLLARSSIYETAPWGILDQPDFLNMCVKLETRLSPHALLDAGLLIELEAGRRRVARWGPRTLDIDILVYSDLALHDERLTIPHPKLAERIFVIMPLLEIEPGLIIEGHSITDIAKTLNGAGIRKISPKE